MMKLKLCHFPLTSTALACALNLFACVSKESVQPIPPSSDSPDLTGRWTSDCNSASATQGATLDFEFTKSDWAVDYTVFADKQCSAKFLTVRISGPYLIGDKSSTVVGAYEARFGFSSKTITPHIDAAAQFLTSAAGCGQAGFASGRGMDIGMTGCPNLGQRPIADCGADYDLVKIELGRVIFGDRPADNNMCTEALRPKVLSKVSSIRK
jgi:hypothetical protein